jgi:lipid A 3-O-deacylase
MKALTLLFALVLYLPSAALATDAPKRGTLTLQLENDRFSDTDRHYTHGSRLSWVSAKDDIPKWAAQVMSWVTPPGMPDNKRSKHRIGYVFGQDIFTPEDISREDLIIDDRPYAGWVYAGLSLHAETDTRLDTVELDVGLVGPESFAEDVQTIVHDIINVQRPNGWDNQLKNEPGLVVIFDRRWRLRALRHKTLLEWDVIPAVGASLGNVRTHASLGGIVRIGQSLPLDFGPAQIRPSLSAPPAFDAPKSFGWYVFGGAEARAVLWNVFLDGNTFTESHDVSKKPVVGSFTVGATAAYGRARITFSHVFRTKEYDGQGKPDQFGTVSLSFNF